MLLRREEKYRSEFVSTAHKLPKIRLIGVHPISNTKMQIIKQYTLPFLSEAMKTRI